MKCTLESIYKIWDDASGLCTVQISDDEDGLGFTSISVLDGTRKEQEILCSDDVLEILIDALKKKLDDHKKGKQ